MHPHGAMRRKERQITDIAEISNILKSGKVMNLALADNNVPFTVPVFYAYDGIAVYFHSALAGTKIEMMKKNSLVCFSVSVDNGCVESDKACDFEARHRTVIGLGHAVFIEDEAEKIKALDMIVALFTDKKFEYPKNNLGGTAVIRIDIESIKGKKHGI